MFPLLPPTFLNHYSRNGCDTEMYGEKWEHSHWRFCFQVYSEFSSFLDPALCGLCSFHRDPRARAIPRQPRWCLRDCSAPASLWTRSTGL